MLRPNGDCGEIRESNLVSLPYCSVYRVWHDYKLLRKDSVVRAKQKVSKFVKHNDMDALRKFIASWSGHAQWANTHNLFNWMEKRYGIAI